MAPRIVLFGATGYTGRLTAKALVDRGRRPVLAGRSEERLQTLAHELGGLEWQRANVGEPRGLTDVLSRGDVLISTVGPFAQWGETAVQAAIEKGAHYLDSTGEGAFVRRVFEDFGPRAREAGNGLLTAFGADWVPGHLAGGLALRESGDAARRVDVGYFLTGSGGAMAMSGGTRASAAGIMLDPGFAWRDGRIVSERSAARVGSFDVNGRERSGLSVAGSEHFGLPRLAPSLREVNVYLGWFGSLSRPLQLLGAGTAAAMRLPLAESVMRGAAERLLRGSSGGPDASARARTGIHAVAVARDGEGEQLAAVHVAGANPYDFTAAMLAWGASTALDGGLRGSGALGPVDGFGLEALQAGCAEADVHRV
jgi:short subunit dehydrogenase-like uncharacterized protein